MAEVTLARDGHVARLTLNRPAKKNALNAAMWAAIPPLVAEVAADDAVRVLILTGAGEAFAAGADIAEFETVYATAESAARYTATVKAANEALAAFPKPALAMIGGACVGGGAALALCCDLRFASADARFGITPAKLGLSYPFLDTRRLVEAVGPGRAKDILFSGRILDAEEALRFGLIDRVAAPDALEAAVMAYAATLVANSPVSQASIKRMVALAQGPLGPDAPEPHALYLEAFAADDFREGYAAFVAKRPPRF